IYNDDNELCGPNETGELYARRKTSPQFTYQNKDQARREIDRDGFITNGDIGMLDEEGYLFIMDRKRDMIISGGVNIYPAEIEAVLLQHPHIADAAVFGIPDDEFGEAICAYVQPHNAVLDESELRAWIEERCGRFKTPKTIRFSEQLPREETGKIFKRKLREPFWEGREKKI
ncbi:MAG: AMP-binding enzyme, partial [Gammaproteobacteria bacterium]